MPFQKIVADKLSQSVVKQVESLILQGILRPGERLPSERELADMMGVSRPSLRDALSELQETGLLSARAGAGIYVADVLGSSFSPALMRLISTHDDALFDYIDFRKDMEGLAAERAAKMGSDTDLKVINATFEKMDRPQNKRNADEDAKLDAQFHMSIFEASHNVVMLHMMRSMYDLLREGVFYNRKIMFEHRTSREALLEQHRAINTALQARDPVAARTAVHAHLDHVANALTEARKAQKNEIVAQKRFEHESSL